MARIFILEDEEHSRNAIVHIVKTFQSDLIPYAAANLDDAAKLLNNGCKYDLFLLDVNLNPADANNSSGIEFARLIRKMQHYEFTPIVMITSVPEMEIMAFREIQCYQYILKPFQRESIETVLKKVISHLKEETRSTLIVKREGINYSIHCDEIIYCKAVPRGVLLCLKEETLAVPYLSIKQFLEKVPEGMFFRCHRMFAVNLQYVEYYDTVNQIIKVENCEEQIDIGVTYKAEVRRLLHG